MLVPLRAALPTTEPGHSPSARLLSVGYAALRQARYWLLLLVLAVLCGSRPYRLFTRAFSASMMPETWATHCSNAPLLLITTAGKNKQHRQNRRNTSQAYARAHATSR